MNTHYDPYMTFSDITTEEMMFLQQATNGLSERQKQYFYMVYSGKRRSPQEILIYTLLGFVLINGVQRFVTGQTVMGLLYLFTGGFCLIGTIIDLVNHRSLATEYNQKMAYESFQITKMAVQE
ncbi:TM2 domain-containing protein [Mucilaginibacter psychrotolerans]|uniref:TM2 domain-containing protein n=1 Tax=Mucilaginibacter psychrotolerans TaxID=1524096 RepID=A0A4Y8SME1_9SPHI|nr:TM2 domain-containing protein [Mucilaginibacter psychrotolerans]TFF40219.1 TM2 domain-containing protein [Mucilaginibacter psychrotolerans]